jgi:hypothetical protein
MEENDLFKGLESFLTSADAIDEGLIATPQTPVENADPVVTTNEDEPEFKGLSLDELSEVENEEVETDEPEVPVIDEPEEVVADTDNVEIYKSLSDFLKNEGIVEDEFDSPDAMRETFKKVIDSNIDDWKSSLPEEIHRLIENYQAGVPFNKLLDIASKEIELANIDEDTLVEDLDLQRKIAEDYLKATTKFSDARIKKEINAKEDHNELEDFSKEALESLKEEYKQEVEAAKKAAKEMEAMQKQERVEQLNFLNKQISEVKEIIPGVKISDAEKKEIFRMITTAAELRGNDGYTQAMLVREKDPIGFETKLNYYIKLGLFDEKPNFETVIKKTTTKTVEKFEKNIEEQMKKRVNIHGSNQSADLQSDTLKAISTIFK